MLVYWLNAVNGPITQAVAEDAFDSLPTSLPLAAMRACASHIALIQFTQSLKLLNRSQKETFIFFKVNFSNILNINPAKRLHVFGQTIS